MEASSTPNDAIPAKPSVSSLNLAARVEFRQDDHVALPVVLMQSGRPALEIDTIGVHAAETHPSQSTGFATARDTVHEDQTLAATNEAPQSVRSKVMHVIPPLTDLLGDEGQVQPRVSRRAVADSSLLQSARDPAPPRTSRASTTAASASLTAFASASPDGQNVSRRTLPVWSGTAASRSVRWSTGDGDVDDQADGDDGERDGSPGDASQHRQLSPAETARLRSRLWLSARAAEAPAVAAATERRRAMPGSSGAAAAETSVVGQFGGTLGTDAALTSDGSGSASVVRTGASDEDVLLSLMRQVRRDMGGAGTVAGVDAGTTDENNQVTEGVGASSVPGAASVAAIDHTPASAPFSRSPARPPAVRSAAIPALVLRPPTNAASHVAPSAVAAGIVASSLVAASADGDVADSRMPSDAAASSPPPAQPQQPEQHHLPSQLAAGLAMRRSKVSPRTLSQSAAAAAQPSAAVPSFPAVGSAFSDEGEAAGDDHAPFTTDGARYGASLIRHQPPPSSPGLLSPISQRLLMMGRGRGRGGMAGRGGGRGGVVTSTARGLIFADEAGAHVSTGAGRAASKSRLGPAAMAAAANASVPSSSGAAASPPLNRHHHTSATAPAASSSGHGLTLHFAPNTIATTLHSPDQQLIAPSPDADSDRLLSGLSAAADAASSAAGNSADSGRAMDTARSRIDGDESSLVTARDDDGGADDFNHDSGLGAASSSTAVAAAAAVDRSSAASADGATPSVVFSAATAAAIIADDEIVAALGIGSAAPDGSEPASSGSEHLQHQHVAGVQTASANVGAPASSSSTPGSPPALAAPSSAATQPVEQQRYPSLPSLPATPAGDHSIVSAGTNARSRLSSFALSAVGGGTGSVVGGQDVFDAAVGGDYDVATPLGESRIVLERATAAAPPPAPASPPLRASDLRSSAAVDNHRMPITPSRQRHESRRDGGGDGHGEAPAVAAAALEMPAPPSAAPANSTDVSSPAAAPESALLDAAAAAVQQITAALLHARASSPARGVSPRPRALSPSLQRPTASSAAKEIQQQNQQQSHHLHLTLARSPAPTQAPASSAGAMPRPAATAVRALSPLPTRRPPPAAPLASPSMAASAHSGLSMSALSAASPVPSHLQQQLSPELVAAAASAVAARLGISLSPSRQRPAHSHAHVPAAVPATIHEHAPDQHQQQGQQQPQHEHNYSGDDDAGDDGYGDAASVTTSLPPSASVVAGYDGAADGGHRSVILAAPARQPPRSPSTVASAVQSTATRASAAHDVNGGAASQRLPCRSHTPQQHKAASSASSALRSLPASIASARLRSTSPRVYSALGGSRMLAGGANGAGAADALSSARSVSVGRAFRGSPPAADAGRDEGGSAAPDPAAAILGAGRAALRRLEARGVWGTSPDAAHGHGGIVDGPTTNLAITSYPASMGPGEEIVHDINGDDDEAASPATPRLPMVSAPSSSSHPASVAGSVVGAATSTLAPAVASLTPRGRTVTRRSTLSSTITAATSSSAALQHRQAVDFPYHPYPPSFQPRLQPQTPLQPLSAQAVAELPAVTASYVRRLWSESASSAGSAVASAAASVAGGDGQYHPGGDRTTAAASSSSYVFPSLEELAAGPTPPLALLQIEDNDNGAHIQAGNAAASGYLKVRGLAASLPVLAPATTSSSAAAQSSGPAQNAIVAAKQSSSGARSLFYSPALALAAACCTPLEMAVWIELQSHAVASMRHDLRQVQASLAAATREMDPGVSEEEMGLAYPSPPPSVSAQQQGRRLVASLSSDGVVSDGWRHQDDRGGGWQDIMRAAAERAMVAAEDAADNGDVLVDTDAVAGAITHRAADLYAEIRRRSAAEASSLELLLVELRLFTPSLSRVASAARGLTSHAVGEAASYGHSLQRLRIVDEKLQQQQAALMAEHEALLQWERVLGLADDFDGDGAAVGNADAVSDGGLDDGGIDASGPEDRDEALHGTTARAPSIATPIDRTAPPRLSTIPRDAWPQLLRDQISFIEDEERARVAAVYQPRLEAMVADNEHQLRAAVEGGAERLVSISTQLETDQQSEFDVQLALTQSRTATAHQKADALTSKLAAVTRAVANDKALRKVKSLVRRMWAGLHPAQLALALDCDSEGWSSDEGGDDVEEEEEEGSESSRASGADHRSKTGTAVVAHSHSAAASTRGPADTMSAAATASTVRPDTQTALQQRPRQPKRFVSPLLTLGLAGMGGGQANNNTNNASFGGGKDGVVVQANAAEPDRSGSVQAASPLHVPTATPHTVKHVRIAIFTSTSTSLSSPAATVRRSPSPSSLARRGRSVSRGRSGGGAADGLGPDNRSQRSPGKTFTITLPSEPSAATVQGGDDELPFPMRIEAVDAPLPPGQSQQQPDERAFTVFPSAAADTTVPADASSFAAPAARSASASHGAAVATNLVNGYTRDERRALAAQLRSSVGPGFGAWMYTLAAPPATATSGAADASSTTAIVAQSNGSAGQRLAPAAAPSSALANLIDATIDHDANLKAARRAARKPLARIHDQPARVRYVLCRFLSQALRCAPYDRDFSTVLAVASKVGQRIFSAQKQHRHRPAGVPSGGTSGDVLSTPSQSPPSLSAVIARLIQQAQQRSTASDSTNDHAAAVAASLPDDVDHSDADTTSYSAASFPSTQQGLSLEALARVPFGRRHDGSGSREQI